MKIELFPSMMCADHGRFADEIAALESAGADGFHIDIMDGRFVPNHAMSLGDLGYFAKTARVPLDVHFMIERPGAYIDPFLAPLRPGDRVFIHAESDPQCAAVLQRIASRGLIPGIALNPGTSVESARELLKIAENVLVMTVNPGRAGQKYLTYVDEKISSLLALKDRYGFGLELDGAISADVIKRHAPAGVKGFVLGTSLLFGKNEPYGRIISRARELCRG